MNVPRGRHSHTWTWWGTSALLTPVFDIFRSHWVPFLCPTRSDWPPLSAEKNQFVYITFTSRNNLSQNWSYFSQISVIWPFWNILYQFYPWFSILLTPFFTVLRSFWPLIFTKPKILLGPFLTEIRDIGLINSKWRFCPGGWSSVVKQWEYEIITLKYNGKMCRLYLLFCCAPEDIIL